MHVGHGHELTVAGYLYRVVLSLVAVGAVALVVYWATTVAGAVRTAAAAGNDDEAAESRG